MIGAESTETVQHPYWTRISHALWIAMESICPMNFHSVRVMLVVVVIWCKLLGHRTCSTTVFKRLIWQNVAIPELKVMTSHFSTYQSPMDMTKIIPQGNDFQAQPYNKREPLFMSRTPLKLLSNTLDKPWLLRALNWTPISHRILPGERGFD